MERAEGGSAWRGLRGALPHSAALDFQGLCTDRAQSGLRNLTNRGICQGHMGIAASLSARATIISSCSCLDSAHMSPSPRCLTAKAGVAPSGWSGGRSRGGAPPGGGLWSDGGRFSGEAAVQLGRVSPLCTPTLAPPTVSGDPPLSTSPGVSVLAAASQGGAPLPSLGLVLKRHPSRRRVE